jgi:hypothetical protein
MPLCLGAWRTRGTPVKGSALLIAAVCACLALVGCGTVIPDVKGMSVADGRAAITAAGFKVEVAYDEGVRGATSTVVAQKPEAGGRARDGSSVSLTVAGAPPVVTPDIGGLDQAAAKAALEAANLALGAVTDSYNASVTAGLVTSQTVGAGAEIPKGSAVGIVLSKGPEPVAVPQVTAYPIPVTLETASEPALIRRFEEHGGATFVLVDNVQLMHDGDAGPWFKNENPKLRTFVLPHDARFALHYIPEVTREEWRTGSPHTVSYERFREVLRQRVKKNDVYTITARNGVVSSVVEVYFP